MSTSAATSIALVAGRPLTKTPEPTAVLLQRVRATPTACLVVMTIGTAASSVRRPVVSWVQQPVQRLAQRVVPLER